MGERFILQIIAFCYLITCAVYILNPAVGIMVILISPRVSIPRHTSAFGQSSVGAAPAKVSRRWAESLKLTALLTLPLSNQHRFCAGQP